MRMLAPAAVGLTFGFIAVAFRRYLLSLDELARRMQLESIAWTYLTVLVLSMGLGTLSLVMKWNFNIIYWFILAEPIRAGWLYLGTRKY